VLERQAGQPLEHSSSLGTSVRTPDGATLPLLVLASERMDADPRWRLLESGELVHVSDTLQTTTRSILGHPPTHPLTLAQLSPTAQASQASIS
jgi:glutamine amidotransferase